MSEKSSTTIRYSESPWGWVFMGMAIMAMATCEAVTFQAETDLRIAKMNCIGADE